MNCIHLVDGEKGGVGKSIVAQAMFYYCLKTLRLIGKGSLPSKKVNSLLSQNNTQKNGDVSLPSPSYSVGDAVNVQSNEEEDEIDDYTNNYTNNLNPNHPNIPLILIDADVTNQDVRKIYKEKYADFITEGFFSENQQQSEKSDSIFNAAFGKVVIVNVPSSAKVAIDSWFDLNDLFSEEDSYTTPVKFVRWFVSNGTEKSLDLFSESTIKYDKMIHVLVKNMYFDKKWERLQDSKYSKAVEKSIPCVFPALKESCVKGLREEGLSYDKALMGKGYFRNTVVDRHVVKVFIDKFSSQFKGTKQFEYLENLGETIRGKNPSSSNDLTGGSANPPIEKKAASNSNETDVEVTNDKKTTTGHSSAKSKTSRK